MGVRVKVGFKDSVGVQIGQNFPYGTIGVHGASGAFGAHRRLRATTLATNCWPEAPGGGGASWRPETRGVPPPPPGGFPLPQVGKVATSPLPYRGSPPLQSGGQNQKWPTSGQSRYLTPAVSGIPTASEQGAKSEVAQK